MNGHILLLMSSETNRAAYKCEECDKSFSSEE